MVLKYKILALIPLLLFSFSAHASWDYIAYANGHIMADVFEGIKAIIFTNTSYRTIIVIIAVSSFVWVMAKSLLDAKYVDIMIYVILVFLANNLLFNNTIDVLVTDPFDASVNYNITGVPMIIGLPVVAVNAIGTELTKTYETNFSNLDPSLQISGGASPGSMSRILRDIATVQVGNPTVRSNLTVYYQDCVLPMIYEGSISIEEISNSADVLTTIRSTHQSRYTMVIPAGGGKQEAQTCTFAWDNLNVTFAAASAGDNKNWYDIIDKGQQIGNDALKSAFAGSIASDAILDAAILQGTGQATSGSVYISNMLVGNGLNDGIKAAATASGSDEIMMGLNMDQAKRSQEMSWWTSGELFQDMSGYFYSTMNVLIVALTPLLMLAIFIPKAGMKVIGMYFKVLIWLALWWPGLAVVNYMTSMFLGYQIVGGQASCTACGFGSINDSSMTSAYAAKAAAATGFLATIVPMLMWGIVSGSAQALVGALQQASGKQQANTAAQNIATDSYQDNNISYNNTAANKFDNTDSFATGSGPIKYDTGNAATNMTDHAASQNVNKGGQNVSNMMTTENAAQQSEITQMQKQADATLQSGLTTAATDAMSKINSHTHMVDGKMEWKTSETYQKNKAELDSAMNEISTLSQAANDKTHSATDEAGAALKAGIGAGDGKSGLVGKVLDFVGVKAEASVSTSNTSKDTETNSVKEMEAEANKNSTTVSAGSTATEGVDRNSSNSEAESSGTADSSNKSVQESTSSNLMKSHSESVALLDKAESSLKTSQSEGYNQDVTMDQYEAMQEKHDNLTSEIKANDAEMKEEYMGMAGEAIEAHGTVQDTNQQAVADQGAALEINSDQVESRIKTAAQAKGDLLGKNYNGMTELSTEQIKNSDNKNEQALKNGKDAVDVDIGGGVTAKPIGVANLSDGKDGHTTEVVYDFQKDGKSIGSGMITEDKNGDIDIREASGTDRGKMREDMIEYRDQGKPHTLAEAVGARVDGRSVAGENEFKGKVQNDYGSNGTIAHGKLDIGQSNTIKTTESTMNGVPGSGGAVANTAMKLSMADPDKH